jgi:hypothetical protein
MMYNAHLTPYLSAYVCVNMHAAQGCLHVLSCYTIFKRPKSMMLRLSMYNCSIVGGTICHHYRKKKQIEFLTSMNIYQTYVYPTHPTYSPYLRLRSFPRSDEVTCGSRIPFLQEDALHCACRHGHLEIVKELLEAHAVSSTADF